MLYLIKSPKWTKHYKRDTYWAPEQCGYVHLIADAGFYTEEEMLKITRVTSKDGALAVPVTPEILKKAKRECNTKQKQIQRAVDYEAECYRNAVIDLYKQQEKNKERFELLEKIEKKIQS